MGRRQLQNNEQWGRGLEGFRAGSQSIRGMHNAQPVAPELGWVGQGAKVNDLTLGGASPKIS